MPRILAIAVVTLNVAGNLLLRRGMQAEGPLLSLSPLDYVRPLLNPSVAMGVLLLVGWLIAQLSLFSWADLSYALPVTSLTYILSAVLGAVALHEEVAPLRWVAMALILAGIVLVGGTAPRTRRLK